MLVEAKITEGQVARGCGFPAMNLSKKARAGIMQMKGTAIHCRSSSCPSDMQPELGAGAGG